jgi:membrane dipeptidase
VGIDYVGLGSDFDGIDQNLELADASMMPQLAAALQEAGFSENEIEKVFYKNVLRVYSQIL